jgi:hypothetical protein
MNSMEVIDSLLDEQSPNAQEIADTLLAHAVNLDDNRPSDDISVVVLKVTALNGDTVRRMNLRVPIEGYLRP